MELVNKSKNVLKNTIIVLPLALILITIVYFNDPVLHFFSLSACRSSVGTEQQSEKCDIFTGEWIPNPDAPYYTNVTCHHIHEHQNCMKYGRPDFKYLKWRWKPHGCDLPIFDPYEFLNVVRGKTMAFVGDSIGRNQVQSMMCLLSKVEKAVDVSPTADFNFKRWRYVNYNFTLSCFWWPFLVRSEQRQDTDGPSHTGLFNLYLDEVDPSWTNEIDSFDYLIINAGHWFARTAVYYENRNVIGCRYCQLPNIASHPVTFGERRAFRTVFNFINGRKSYGGVTFLRTLAPQHFENGEWNAGGDCVRKHPFRRSETRLVGENLALYGVQLEEFRVAEKKKKLRLMDLTQAMLLRPDGHPSRYGHWPNANVTLYNDCVHWCLPGPIDSWAQFLLHMFKIES